VRILGSPVMQVMAVDVAIIVKNTFVREQNVFGKMIIFLTCIKEPSTISQSASFIINMQLLGQSYFVGMEVSRFQNSADWCLTNSLFPRHGPCTDGWFVCNHLLYLYTIYTPWSSCTKYEKLMRKEIYFRCIFRNFYK